MMVDAERRWAKTHDSLSTAPVDSVQVSATGMEGSPLRWTADRQPPTAVVWGSSSTGGGTHMGLAHDGQGLQACPSLQGLPSATNGTWLRGCGRTTRGGGGVQRTDHTPTMAHGM